MTSEDQSPRRADVSVIIPAYQAADTIARAIDSVFGQSVLPAEIIVIDDGSRDRTRDIVAGYVSRPGPCPVRLLEQENLGAGAARNQGLEAATQAVVAFLDADDEWMAEKLGRSLDVMDRERANIVAHDYLRADQGREEPVSCAHHFNRRPDPFAEYFLRGYIATSTVVARRDVLMRAGGFDPSLRSGQDYELWLAAISAADTRHHVFAEALTRYHVTANSITSQVDLRRRAALRILHRHLPALRARTGHPRFVGMMRAAVICVQAAQAHRDAGNRIGAIGAIAGLPIHVVSIMASRMNRAVDRPTFVSSDEATE